MTFVIPAKAGIHFDLATRKEEQTMDPGFRRDDGSWGQRSQAFGSTACPFVRSSK